MENCIFCKIINRELPASIVYEDDKVLAFNDIHPEAPVHVLIVPKQHVANLNEITSENADIIVDIHIAIKKVAEKLGVSESGFRVITNCGAGSGQTVFHLHYHVLAGSKLGTKLL